MGGETDDENRETHRNAFVCLFVCLYS